MQTVPCFTAAIQRDFVFWAGSFSTPGSVGWRGNLQHHCTRPDPSGTPMPRFSQPFLSGDPTFWFADRDRLTAEQQKRPGEIAVDSLSHTLALFYLLSLYHTTCQIDGDCSSSSLPRTFLFSLQPLLIPQNVRPSSSTFKTSQAIIGFCLHVSSPHQSSDSRKHQRANDERRLSGSRNPRIGGRQSCRAHWLILSAGFLC